MAKIRDREVLTAGKDVENLQFLNCAGRMRWYNPLQNYSTLAPKRKPIQSPEISLFFMYATETHAHIHQITYENVPRSTIAERAKLKATNINMDR